MGDLVCLGTDEVAELVAFQLSGLDRVRVEVDREQLRGGGELLSW